MTPAAVTDTFPVQLPTVTLPLTDNVRVEEHERLQEVVDHDALTTPGRPLTANDAGALDPPVSVAPTVTRALVFFCSETALPDRETAKVVGVEGGTGGVVEPEPDVPPAS